MHLLRFGKPPATTPMARPHPLMQARLDYSLPFWVATDHAIWGTWNDPLLAVAQAKALVPLQPEGERIIVSSGSEPVWCLVGSGPRGYPDQR